MTDANDLAAPDALRQLVREVLRDVLPALAELAPANGTDASSLAGSEHGGHRAAAGYRVAAGPPPPRPPTSVPQSDAAAPSLGGTPPRGADPAAEAGTSLRAVRLSTDEELHAFVLQVLRLADNPQRRRELLAGRLRFTLAPAAGGRPVPATAQRVDKGAVTERAVIAAAKAGSRLVLGPRAVLTPLARDKARALGVPVEKER
jgi:hypothetical protein